MRIPYRFVLSLLPALAVGAMAVESCRQPGSPSTGNPSTSLDSGIAGIVILVDSLGNPLPSVAGVRVSIDTPNVSTTTDAQGHWQIKDLGLGYWHVTFSLPGFGTTWTDVDKSTDFFPPPPGSANWLKVVPTQILGQIPSGTLRLDSLRLGWDNNFHDSIVLVYSSDPQYPFPPGFRTPGVLACVSDDSTFSETTTHLFESAGYYYLYPSHPIFGVSHPGAGLTPGSTAYVAVYEIAASTYASTPPDQIPSQSWDLPKQRYVYTARGPRSNVMSFIVPR